MKRVIIYCEGPSEETFINHILGPKFIEDDVYITATSFGGFQNIVSSGKNC